MIEVKLNRPVALKTEQTQGYLLEPGVRYIVADSHALQFEEDYIIEMKQYLPPNLYTGQNLHGKSLICFRTGGLGDLLFISASLNKVKNAFPDSKLTLVCTPDYINILKSESYNVLPLPVVALDVEKYDYVLFFSGVIEQNKVAEEYNAFDLIAQHFSLYGLDDGNYKASVYLSPENILKAQTYLNPENINILLHLSASVPKRSMPVNTIAKFISETPDNWKFHIVGAHSQVDSIDAFIGSMDKHIGPGKVVSISKKFPSIDECAALVSCCNLVIGPDSGILHIAEALDKPLVGLFGPFPSDLRLRYYKYAVGIDSNSNCENARGKYRSCFEHGDGSCKLAGKTHEYFSPCMQLIKSEHIHTAVQLLGFNSHKQ